MSDVSKESSVSRSTCSTAVEDVRNVSIITESSQFIVQNIVFMQQYSNYWFYLMYFN